MMDNRRLDLAGVIGSGILNLPVPDSDVPRDRESFDPETDNFRFAGIPVVVESLEQGKLVSSTNYYGIPYVWKEGSIYRVIRTR